jgi:hypothetical protein
LNGAGSLFSSKRLILRCRGRKVSRNNPAKAITNFFERDENRILFIGNEGFTGYVLIHGYCDKCKFNKS